MVNLVIHIHLSAIVAAAPPALLDAPFRGAPDAQGRWGDPTIVLLAVAAVAAGVLSLLMR